MLRTRRTTIQLIMMGATELRKAAEDRLNRGKETLQHLFSYNVTLYVVRYAVTLRSIVL